MDVDPIGEHKNARGDSIVQARDESHFAGEQTRNKRRKGHGCIAAREYKIQRMEASNQYMYFTYTYIPTLGSPPCINHLIPFLSYHQAR